MTNARTAIVTGASRGLGRVMALALLQAGHRVLLTATSESGLRDVIRESGARERVHVAAGDLGQEATPGRLVGEAEERFGGVDVLVANAATVEEDRPLLDVEAAVYRRYFEINTIAPVQLTRLVVPGMVERGWGRIVFISTSLDTMLRDYGNGPYGATKAAGEALMAVLAAGLDGTGVTVNALLPGGPAATGAATAFPQEQLLRPEIMGPPIQWLASDAADEVTGRRFTAARWDPSQPQAASAPIAWTGLGERAILPRRAPS